MYPGLFSLNLVVGWVQAPCGLTSLPSQLSDHRYALHVIGRGRAGESTDRRWLLKPVLSLLTPGAFAISR